MVATATRNVTLSQWKADIQAQGDVAGATLRHTPTLLTRLINQSIQRFRERITVEGANHFLVGTAGTTGTGVTSPYHFYELDLSSGLSPALVRTFGIDLKVNNELMKLEQIPFEQRSDWGSYSQTGQPVVWAHYQRSKVALLPAPNQAYPYVLWYLPTTVDLAADTDTWDGVAGWEDFITWDVVCRLIARDQYPDAFAIASAYRVELFQDILRTATKVSFAGGARTGRDSMGAKMRLGGKSRLPPP